MNQPLKMQQISRRETTAAGKAALRRKAPRNLAMLSPFSINIYITIHSAPKLSLLVSHYPTMTGGLESA